MRWLLTGSRGMLGSDVLALLSSRGHEVSAPTRDRLDILDEAAVDEAVAGHDVVVNCAAWTAVDDAETQEAAAFAVNAVGPGLLARAARRAGARMVHISTDYVFDGAASSPYAEDAAIAPASAYGRTKAAGEWAVRAELPLGHLVLRTAWLYGARGTCFPRTIVDLTRQRGEISVVEDQHGQPTWTRDVAELALRLVEREAPAGVYHATARGQTSWHGFAKAAVASAGLDPEAVRATTSAQFPRPAPRPAYSVLGHAAVRALDLEPIGPWEARWEQAAAEVLGASAAT